MLLEEIMIKAILLLFSLATALWMGGGAFVGLWRYWSLDQESVAQVVEWNVLELSPSKFAVEVTYRFNDREGKTIFTPAYFNRPSAEKAIQQFAKDRWTVWYNARHSSLQKEFPIKKCLYTLLALGVCGYFFSLKTS